MLTSRGKASAGAALGAVALAAPAALAVLSLPAGSAFGSAPSPSVTSSSGSLDCTPAEVDPRTHKCFVKGSDSGSPSSSSSASQSGGESKGGAPECHYQTAVVSCGDNTLGWYDSSASCYYKLEDPQPPPTDQIWNGRPAGGAIYKAQCFNVTTVGSKPVLAPIDPVWLQNPPPGTPLTPGDVANMAIAELVMHGPTIGIAPPPTAYALVGVPVWLWTNDDPQHTFWGPQRAES